MRCLWFFIWCLVCFDVAVYAQIEDNNILGSEDVLLEKTRFNRPNYMTIDKDSALQQLAKMPSFTMFRDNYIITGVPLNEPITKDNADMKFQISISQRLTKHILPWQTSLALTYTQKSFWHVYESSSPFLDNNYNPGLSLSKMLIGNNDLKGFMVLSLEHESNGQPDPTSRSWNYFSLSALYYFNMLFTIQGKVWAGWVSETNPDLMKYKGYGLMALNYRSESGNFWMSLILNPYNKFSGINTTVEVNYRWSKFINQYLFLQFYSGYAENLLNYNQYTSMIRLGICIKPTLRNIY